MKARSRWTPFWAIVAVLLVLGYLYLSVTEDSSTSSPSSRSAAGPATRPAAPSWTEVASWTGSGIKETETFQTNSREWRITWELRDPNGMLAVIAYEDGNPMPHVAVNQSGVGKDVSYVRTAPGPHYLNINGIGDWSVTVEDQR